MRNDIIPGAAMPDYELPDHNGRVRRLSAIQGIDPMIVHIARGSFCPSEHQMGRDLARLFLKLRVGHASLVTITPDTRRELIEFRAAIGAGWVFLGDPTLTVATDLDIVEYTEPTHDAAIPHTFVVAPGMRIHSIYNGYFYWGRPTVDELHRDLREVCSALPDWDITSPDVRAAWQDATLRKDTFYPYGQG